MTVRRLVSLLGLAVCATALTGCGSVRDTLSLDPVANAATKTAATDSARVAFNATVNVGSLGSMTMQGRGIYDGRSKTGWMNMNVSFPASAQPGLGGNQSMEMIYDAHDGLVMYMRSPLFAQVAGGKWIKMDLAKLAKEKGVDLGAVMNANQADPNQTLRMLMASSGARVSGSDSIRGVATTRYSFRVDLARLAKDSKALRDSLDQVIQNTGISSYPAEAWIDKQGRVRRLKVAMSMSAPGAGPMTMTITEDLFGFGARAHVYPPPADQIIDLSAPAGG